MPGRRRLTPWDFTWWPDLTALAREWQTFIERCDSWSWGPGFHVEDNDAGRTVSLQLPPVIHPGVATGTITARATNTVGSGTFKLRALDGTTLSDSTTGLTVYSNFSTSVASGKAIMVGYDGGRYWLISADCP